MVRTDTVTTITRPRSAGVPTQRLLGNCPSPAVCFDYRNFLKSLWGFDGDAGTMPFPSSRQNGDTQIRHKTDISLPVEDGVRVDQVPKSNSAKQLQRTDGRLKSAEGTFTYKKDKRSPVRLAKPARLIGLENADEKRQQRHSVPRGKTVVRQVETLHKTIVRYYESPTTAASIETLNKSQISSKSSALMPKDKMKELKFGQQETESCAVSSQFELGFPSETPGSQIGLKKSLQRPVRKLRRKSNTRDSSQKLVQRSVSPSLTRETSYYMPLAVSTKLHPHGRSKSLNSGNGFNGASNVAGKNISSPLVIHENASTKALMRPTFLAPLAGDKKSEPVLNQNTSEAKQIAFARKKTRKVHKWAISLDTKPNKKPNRRRRTQKIPQMEAVNARTQEHSEAKSFFTTQQDRMRAAAFYSSTSSSDPTFSELPDIPVKVLSETPIKCNNPYMNRLAEGIEAVKIEDFTLKPKNTKRKKIVRRASTVSSLKPSPRQPVKDAIKEKAGTVKKSNYTTVRSTSKVSGSSASGAHSRTTPSSTKSPQTPLSKTASQTSPAAEQQKCPNVLIDEFKTRVQNGRGKGQIYPSHVPMVDYTPVTASQTHTRIGSVPKTYQQLGLAPLMRSPSSENYFLDVVSMIKGVDVTLPKRKPSHKSKAKKSTRDKTGKKKSGCCPVIKQSFDKGAQNISLCDAYRKSMTSQCTSRKAKNVASDTLSD